MYKKHGDCFVVCWAFPVAYELCSLVCFLLTGYVLIRTWTLSSTCPRLLSSGARTRLFLSGRLFPGEQNLEGQASFREAALKSEAGSGTVGPKMDPWRAMDARNLGLEAVDKLWLQIRIT
jgi:hypothetical protein